jgi:hypothetical protein
MATHSVHSEGISLQAERVVRAYKALRAAPNSADFSSDSFPVGLFVELVTQIKQLAHWLEPVEGEDWERNQAGIDSAKAELRQQFEQAYVLVSAARDLVKQERDAASACPELFRPLHLLDMADDLLGDLQYLNRVAPPDADEQKDLHEQTLDEVRKDATGADEREVKIRVAIRESFGATRDEEDAAYARISEALS